MDKLKEDIKIEKDNKDNILVRIKINSKEFLIKPSDFEIAYENYVNSYLEFIENQYKGKIKPPYTDCIPFNIKECNTCDECYECNFLLQEIECPNCHNKGDIIRDWGEKYICENCNSPFHL